MKTTLKLTEIENSIETYDVVFSDDSDSQNKGFCASADYCKSWIENNRNENLFLDYTSGTVSIICNETGEEIYCENI